MNRRHDASANDRDSGRWRELLAVAGLVAIATLASAAALADGFDPLRDCPAQDGAQDGSLEACFAPAAGPATTSDDSSSGGGQTDGSESVAQSDPNGPTGSPPTGGSDEQGGTPEQGGGTEEGGGTGDDGGSNGGGSGHRDHRDHGGSNGGGSNGNGNGDD
ncbi:MAG TPA: hypothetical protein VJJ77_00230 [Dongiaceae bacterium]|nr:hypothetical protein [Dongiaceae bacterium]